MTSKYDTILAELELVKGKLQTTKTHALANELTTVEKQMEILVKKLTEAKSILASTIDFMRKEKDGLLSSTSKPLQKWVPAKVNDAIAELK